MVSHATDSRTSQRSPVCSSFSLPPTPTGPDLLKLRTATLVLPRTGERVKRVITLRQPHIAEAGGDGEGTEELGPESPLLAKHRRSTPKSGMSRRDVARKYVTRWARASWEFADSKTGRGIFKCSIAYLLGSMATFVPILSRFLGHQDGKHMVATVTVYFHPARSQGSMFEAAFMAAIAFIYAAFISFTSMGVSVLFDEILDMIVVGHILILIVFCGGGLGIVGWTKQRLQNPLVNVACSLTSLGIITVLTKEGSVQAAEFSVDKVVQVMKMVAMGVIASTVVCFAIFPVSARKELRQNMRELTDSFGDMLSMITRGFLTGSEEEFEQQGFQDAFERYNSLYGSLSKHLTEAKWEHYVRGTEQKFALEMKLVACMRRMAQNIGGLRSAATTQFALIAKGSAATDSTWATAAVSPMTPGLTMRMPRIDSWMSTQGSTPGLEDIPENPFADITGGQRHESSNGLQPGQSPASIFERFIKNLGPSMKSLAYTLKLILDELPYGPAPKFKIAVNPHFRSSLIDAINLYSNARKEALAMLYKSKEMAGSKPASIEADFEEVAASCGHFSYSLQDFAEEMMKYLDVLDELKAERERPFYRKRTWGWLRFWRSEEATKERAQKESDDLEQSTLIERADATSMNGEPSPIKKDIDSINAVNRKSHEGGFGYRIWKSSHWLRRDDTKFAIKVGAGAALYALPSFIEETRPIYSHWRGEWGLLSYMLVCSMTIGASNTTGAARAFGTFLGAVCSVIAWLLSQGSVLAMAFFGWIMSLFTFYLIVGKGKGPFGRFILLTYNLSALYAYSLSVKDNWDDDDEGGDSPVIGEIALHRVVAVLSGCLWGLVITRLIWPISARQKFKNGLSLLLLRMGLIWKRDPLATLTEGEARHSYMKLSEELQLQRYWRQLESLRTAASYEYELRGPFPTAEYSQVLRSLNRILDAFHAMNVMITNDPEASEGETNILGYTASERKQLGARISHLFQVMASSFKLEFPLSDALPSTEHARDRLLAKIFKYRQCSSKSKPVQDEDFILLYAYVTGQVSKEIREVGQVIENLFGVLDEDLLKLQ